MNLGIITLLGSSEVAAIVTAVAGALGTVWGIIQTVRISVNKKVEKRKEEMIAAAKDAVVDTIIEELDDILEERDQKFVENETFEEKICEHNSANQNLRKTLIEVQESQAKLMQNIEKNERMRLKAELIDFLEDLRNGQIKSATAYQHIYAAYDYYKSLKGNGFIEDVFAEIKEYHNKQK